MVIRNRYHVGKRWAKWSRAARAVFNTTYQTMLDQPHINAYPNAPRVPMQAWRTIAWNAAWEAADAAHKFAVVPA